MTLYSLPSIIYLDNSFIIEAYERETGGEVPVKTVRTNDTTFGPPFFGSTGASTSVEKVFPLQPSKMYSKIKDRLDSIELITNVYGGDLPEIFWLEGIFGLGTTRSSFGTDLGPVEPFFQFMHRLGDQKYFGLLVNDSYFTTGFDQIRKCSTASCAFAVKAKLLVRLLFKEAAYSVAAPLIIIKTENVS